MTCFLYFESDVHAVLSRRCSQNLIEGLWISWKSVHFYPYWWHCLVWVKFSVKDQNIMLGICDLHENCGSKSHTFLWASVIWHMCVLCHGSHPLQSYAFRGALSVTCNVCSSPNVSLKYQYYSFLWNSVWTPCHCRQLDALTVGFLFRMALDSEKFVTFIVVSKESEWWSWAPWTIFLQEW